MMIREMTPDDVQEVAAIEQECFSMPWSEKSFLDSLGRDDTLFLVCVADSNALQQDKVPKNDGSIAGYLGMYLSFGEGEITNVAVSPSYRKKGCGQALIQAAIAQARQQAAESIMLEVRKSNASAISLYTKNGFEEIGIRKNFYERPVEDAIIMKVGL